MENLSSSNVEALEALKKEARFNDFANEENPIRVLSKAYNEFFADLAAVLILKDPDAMAIVENDLGRSFRPGTSPPDDYSAELDHHVFFFMTQLGLK